MRYRGAWRRFLLCVQCNLLLGFRLGMTGGAGPLQYTPRVFSSVPLNCVSQCTIPSFAGRSQSCGPNLIALQQALNSPPACFAVSLLSLLTSCQVPAPRTTFTETPLFEVCSAKVGSRHFGLHQHVSRGPGHDLRGSLHSDLNVERIVTAIRGPWNGSRPISPTQGFFRCSPSVS